MCLRCEVIFHGGWGDSAYSYRGEIVDFYYRWNVKRNRPKGLLGLWVALLETGA